MKRTTSKKPKYRSKFEGRVAPLLPKGARYEAETYGYTLDCTYTPDWLLPNGVLLEAKGNFKASERRKLLAVVAQNPGIDLRMVFMRNNRISKTSKTTYLDWCKRHNIRASIYPELPI